MLIAKSLKHPFVFLLKLVFKDFVVVYIFLGFFFVLIWVKAERDFRWTFGKGSIYLMQSE